MPLSKLVGCVNSGIVTDIKLVPITDRSEDLIDIGGLDPRPDIGWTYDGETFAPPSE